MTTLRKRLLVEFDENTVTNHILPVIEEWLQEMRRPTIGRRRTSQQTNIDNILAKAKL